MEADSQESARHSPWNTLQKCWAELRSDEARPFGDPNLSPDLQQRHAQALEALVAGGELEATVAEEVGAAFEQAIAHIQNLMSLCYIAFPAEYLPRQDLMKQVAALEQVAAQDDIDPAAIAQARAALEQDIAWLARHHAGEVPGLPDGVEVSETSAQAARVLVRLLLGSKA